MPSVDESNNTTTYVQPDEHLPVLLAVKGASLDNIERDRASLADALASEAINGPLIEGSDECRELLWIATLIRTESSPEIRLAYLADALEMVTTACAGWCEQARRDNGSTIFSPQRLAGAVDLAKSAMTFMRGIVAQIARDEAALAKGGDR